MLYEKVETPTYRCYKCKEELVFDVKLQRLDTCPNCGAWLHCCYNCKYWNPSVHNECELDRSEFVRDREAANFCTSFEFRPTEDVDINEAEKARKKLESVFGASNKQKIPDSSDEAKKRLEELFKK